MLRKMFLSAGNVTGGHSQGNITQDVPLVTKQMAQDGGCRGGLLLLPSWPEGLSQPGAFPRLWICLITGGADPSPAKRVLSSPRVPFCSFCWHEKICLGFHVYSIFLFLLLLFCCLFVFLNPTQISPDASWHKGSETELLREVVLHREPRSGAQGTLQMMGCVGRGGHNSDTKAASVILRFLGTRGRRWHLGRLLLCHHHTGQVPEPVPRG